MFRKFLVVFALLSSSFMLSGCCLPTDNVCKAKWADGKMSGDGVGIPGGGVDLLTIQLPFVTDEQSLCTQGANGSYSHTHRSTRYDVDLDTPNDSREPVFAPVGGVGYAHTESRTKNYGYHVSIDQGDGTYVLIAHMDDVVIGDGEEVAAGQFIGFEGSTGLADGDHVHIGRHSGDASLMGEYGTSLNALAFTMVDTSTGSTVTEMTTEMTCSLEYGHTYQSTLQTPKWHPSGSLLQIPGSSTVYLLDGFAMRPFMTEGAFTSRNYSWDDVVYITEYERDCFSEGNYVQGDGMVEAVYDRTAYTGAWLLVGAPSDPDRYRQQIITDGASAVLSTWGIQASSLGSLPSQSSLGISLNDYPMPSTDWATFRDGSLVSTYEKSDVYVMEGGAAYPILDWDTYLLMGFGNREVVELSQHDFDELVSIVGNCETDSYCLSNVDVTTCGGDTEDVPGTYPGEGVGGANDGEEEPVEDDNVDNWPSDELTGVGLELWWQLPEVADWITIGGEFTNENGYSYGWVSNITWSTWSDGLYFGITDAGSGDSYRYSYAFANDGVENWSCLGPYPPGELTGVPSAWYNGESITVNTVADPGSDGCGLQVNIP